MAQMQENQGIRELLKVYKLGMYETESCIVS